MYKTKKILVGNVALGGGEKIRIQSMTTTKTADVPYTTMVTARVLPMFVTS